MTDYTTITDAQVDPEAPITSELVTALRNNPLAIIEGAAAAPRIDPINAMAHQGAASAVGTYLFAKLDLGTNETKAVGSTVAGSTLRPSGLAGSGPETTGSYQSGTWRIMGQAQSISGTTYVDHTLVLRIL